MAKANCSILNVKKTSLMPSHKKDVTVSLEGNASLILHNRLTGLDEVVCTPTQQAYTVGVSLWRQRCCGENRLARAFLSGHAACAGKVTLGYAHLAETQVAFTVEVYPTSIEYRTHRNRT